MRGLAVLVAASLAFAPAAAFADVTITSKIFVLSKVTDAKGNVTVKRLEPAKVVPGDRLAIDIDYANDADPANDVVIVNPVPESTHYVGEASEGAQFSIDGGKTYAALETLSVTEGATKRAARPGDVTHVRWVIAKLAARAKGKVFFEVTVD